MNGENRTSLVVVMALAFLVVLSSVVLAGNADIESNVDATVKQVAHWQVMNPNVADSTVSQVAHWQAMKSNAIDSTVEQVAYWQAMNPDITDSTVAQVAHWQAMTKVTSADELVAIDADAVVEVVTQR